MNDQQRRWRAFSMLIGGMTVVGTYVGFSKIIVAFIPIYLLALMRFAIAAILMLPLTFPKGALQVVRANWGTLFLQSLFGNFLFSIFMLSGVARTSATAAGLILSTLPAVVALFSTLALKERVTWRTGLAVILAVVGVASLARTHAASDGSSSTLGDAMVFAAVCCEAAYVVLGKRLTNADVAPMQISAWINLVGLVLVLPLGLWQAVSFPFSSVPNHVWLLLGVYAVCASWISTWLWLSGLKVVPASQAGVFTVALPIAAALIGVAFLGEHLSLAQGFAFMCAASGIVLVTVRPAAAASQAVTTRS